MTKLLIFFISFSLALLSTLNGIAQVDKEYWYSAPFKDFAFESPSKIIRSENSISEDALARVPKGFISAQFYNSSGDISKDGMLIQLFILDHKFDTYDVKRGSKAMLSNLIISIEGEILDHDFYEIDNSHNNVMMTGLARIKGLWIYNFIYCLATDDKVYFLYASGNFNDKNIFDRIDRLAESIVIF